MPHYFFNIEQCGELTEDRVGRECADLRAAEAHAFTVARRVIAEEVLAGELCLSCQIDVLDDQRRLMLTVPFRRAVTLTGD